ncbi:CocE/NonD family hydrolase [Haloarcula japonica]|uniref:Hydrolase n=1 Tax=Haloarcula japonica (strain ATCC 49778 / DSM 6131 / JCM 7785 / NBRC 101032 / NCIMB 13157 / TR-1) TaxID=1227453 RepID=M0L1U1_HALJT|nr:CocE/NonD family hydrolase [Haloarcula japonica]EMA27048.1 hydrolase [Haloarcula japonica DSM 6131]
MRSESSYGVQSQFDVMVRTRDGVELATDIYRPTEDGDVVEEPLPALLSRTPYNKRGEMERHGEWFAKHGYVVAIQDCRGRFNSGGTFEMFVNEPEDGYDTVEWLADRPYCNDTVGTIGSSYGAWVQSGLATQDPPHLEAMFVNQGPANGREATLRHNGAFELRWLCWALTLGGGFAKRVLADGDLQQHFADIDVRDILAESPLQRGQSPLKHLPKYEEWLFEMLTTGDAEDDLWSAPGINPEAYYDEMADVPTVYSGAWYDSYTLGTCKNFEVLSERQSSDQFLIVGPWTHGWNEYPLSSWNKAYSGEVEFGTHCLRNYQETRLRFFDHYLKGKDTWDEPPVQYFQMGTGDGSRQAEGRLYHGGEWRTAVDWPLPESESVKFYAQPDGSLDRMTPAAVSAGTTYQFDPTDPVPTIGGNCSSYITFEQREESLLEYPLEERHLVNITGSGGYDQRTRPETFGADPPYGPLERRDDVIVFRTRPLTEDLEIAGPIHVTLYASTTAPDTDFTAKLIDEYPPSDEFTDGFALNLTDSICRARYRGNRNESDFVEPGEVHEYEFELYPTANVFREGHQIRLDVSSSNFPRYDVNQNTGEELYGGRSGETAENTLYHDSEYPTHVELPVLSE